MKTTVLLKYLLLLVITGIVSCKDKADICKVFLNKELIAELKNKAVDTLQIDNNKYVLDACVYRNFHPTFYSNRNIRLLTASNWLINTDSVVIPNNIDLIKQYVIKGDSIWIADYETKPLELEFNFKKGRISRNGPEWNTYIYVDVISKIHDSNTNKDYFLKIKNVYIEKEE